MYEILSDIANALMQETGIRFSDLHQLQVKVSEIIFRYAQDNNISLSEAAEELQSIETSATIVQKKTSQPVTIKVTATVLNEINKTNLYGISLYELKYTTYRAIQTRQGNYHRTRTGKKLTIAHKRRHDKAKQVFQQTNSEAEAASALGINLKTLPHYLDSDFLY